MSRYIGKDIKERSYLKNAIEKSKVNKVSWDMLFKMTEIGGQSGISIPSFLSVDYKLDDIYAWLSSSLPNIYFYNYSETS